MAKMTAVALQRTRRHRAATARPTSLDPKDCMAVSLVPCPVALATGTRRKSLAARGRDHFPDVDALGAVAPLVVDVGRGFLERPLVGRGDLHPFGLQVGQCLVVCFLRQTTLQGGGFG